MASIFMKRANLTPVIIAMLLCWQATAVGADELRFLPDKCAVLVSVDLAAFLKSKIYQEVTKSTEVFDEILQKEIRDNLGVPIANVALLIHAEGLEGRVVIVTTIKPVGAADIKAAKKILPFYQDVRYKESTAGNYTIYEENFQIDDEKKPGKTSSGEAFCVVEGKYVLHGRHEMIKKILARNKKPNLSAAFQAGIIEAGIASTLTLIVDVQALSAEGWKEVKKSLDEAAPGAADVFDKGLTLTARADAGDKLTGRATLFCKDAVTAAKLNKVADAGLLALKTLADPSKALPRERELMKSVSISLDAIKFSTKDSQIRAEATVEAATAANLLRSMFGTKSTKKPREKIKDAKESK